MQMRQPVVRMISTLLILGASAGCGMRSTLGETDQSLSEDQSGAEGLVPCGGGVSPCDVNDLGDATCESVGAGSGVLACDPVMCLYDTSMCSGDYAGGVGGTGATATGGTDLFGDLLGALLIPPATGDAAPADDFFALLFGAPPETGGDAAPEDDFFAALFGDTSDTTDTGGSEAADPFQEFLDGLFGQRGEDTGDTEETGGVTETGGTEEVEAGTGDGLE